MKNHQLPAIAALVVATIMGPMARAQEPARSLLETQPKGWTSILPRSDLKDWSRVPVPPGAPLGKAQWSIDKKAGTLVCDGEGGHDMLLWNRVIADAVLHIEFRYTKIEGKSGYNSGIYVRNNQDGSIWHQCQIGDASGGYFFGETPTADGGKRFFSTTVPNHRVKPAGEWNTVEITMLGSRLSLWMNGAVTCEIQDCGAAKGLVGVEGEGYRIEFRNIKVKELKPQQVSQDAQAGVEQQRSTLGLTPSQHFLQRMQERGISNSEVMAAIRSGQEFYDPLHDNTVRWKDGVHVAITPDGTLATAIRGDVKRRWVRR